MVTHGGSVGIFVFNSFGWIIDKPESQSRIQPQSLWT